MKFDKNFEILKLLLLSEVEQSIRYLYLPNMKRIIKEKNLNILNIEHQFLLPIFYNL